MEPAPAWAGQGQVDNSDGQPIPGVRVFILPAPEERRDEFLEGKPENWFSSGIQLSTDENGVFPIMVEDPSFLHAIVVRKEGYGWAFEPLDPTRPGEASLLITMKPTEQLFGMVRDIDGQPIAGATVTRQIDYVWSSWKAWPAPRALYAELTRETVKTDEQGRFTFKEVTNDNQVARAGAPGFAECTIGPVPPGYRLNFTLCRAAVIYGRVTDSSGAPVSGALVRSMTYGCIPSQSTEWEETDKEGRYQLDGALSGAIGVIVYSEAGYTLERKNLYIPPGEHTQVDFILEKGTNLDGRITDDQGRPVPGMRVGVMCERTGIVTGEARSDDNGLFHTDACRPGDTYVITVHGTDEYAPRCIHGVMAGTKDLEIRLLSLSIVWGRIEFAGDPAAQVQVRYLPRKNLPGYDGILWALGDPHTVQGSPDLDVNGRTYRHTHWPGVYDLEFRARGYAPMYVNNLVMTPGKRSDPLDLSFEKGHVLRGGVFEQATGAPIAGARIEILEEHTSGQLRRCPDPITATSGANGEFTIDFSPSSVISLEVTADGWAPRTLRNVDPRTMDVAPLRLGLVRGGRVEGRVHTDYANPGSTLQVVVRELGRWDGPSTFVDLKRHYEIEHVPTGRMEVVLIDHQYQRAFPQIGPQIRQVEVQDGETVEVNFDAATGVTLSGRVIGWDKPLLIEARAIEPDDKTPIAGASFTDREGRFHIPHLRPDRYRVGSTVGQPGYSIAVSAEVTIAHEPPDELLLEVPGTTVRGTVQDDAGQPIPRAIVTIEPDSPPASVLSRCLTDGEGHFAIGGIDEGHYTLRARARGRATTLLGNYQAPGPEVTFSLRPEARLSVTVTDDLGLTLPGAQVGLRHTREPRLTYADITGAEGTVLFNALQAIPHEVAASLEGHVPADPLIVPLREDETRSVTLVLVRTGSIDVAVTDPDGKSLEKALVILMDEEGAELTRQLTNKKGHALFEELAPAWYEVAAGPDGEATDAVEVPPGEQTTLDIVVDQG